VETIFARTPGGLRGIGVTHVPRWMCLGLGCEMAQGHPGVKSVVYALVRVDSKVFGVPHVLVREDDSPESLFLCFLDAGLNKVPGSGPVSETREYELHRNSFARNHLI